MKKNCNTPTYFSSWPVCYPKSIVLNQRPFFGIAQIWAMPSQFRFRRAPGHPPLPLPNHPRRHTMFAHGPGQVRQVGKVREKPRFFANFPNFPAGLVGHVRGILARGQRPNLANFPAGHVGKVRAKPRFFANLPNLANFPAGQVGHVRGILARGRRPNLANFPAGQVGKVREKPRFFANFPNLPNFPGGQVRRTATSRTNHS
jgi:hypothetical protein